MPLPYRVAWLGGAPQGHAFPGLPLPRPFLVPLSYPTPLPPSVTLFPPLQVPQPLPLVPAQTLSSAALSLPQLAPSFPSATPVPPSANPLQPPPSSLVIPSLVVPPHPDCAPQALIARPPTPLPRFPPRRCRPPFRARLPVALPSSLFRWNTSRGFHFYPCIQALLTALLFSRPFFHSPPSCRTPSRRGPP